MTIHKEKQGATQEAPAAPWTPEGRQDPHPWYHYMLEHEPVAWHEELHAWGIFKHQDVTDAFRDEASWSAARRLDGIPPEEERYSSKHTLTGTDGPEHTRLSRLVTPGFHPKVIERLRPLADEVATGLLEKAVPKGTFDLMSEFADPLPQRMIAEVLGVPREDLSRFTDLSEGAQGAGRYSGDTEESEEHRRRRHAAHDAYREYFAGLFEERRKAPRDDLLTALVQAEDGGDRLSAEEMMKMATLMFVAGQTTTRTLLSNMIIELARHPAEVRKLRERPELIPSAVEEVLRFPFPGHLHQPARHDGHDRARSDDSRGRHGVALAPGREPGPGRIPGAGALRRRALYEGATGAAPRVRHGAAPVHWGAARAHGGGGRAHTLA